MNKQQSESSIDTALQSLLKQIRKAQTKRGWLLLITITLAGLLVIMLADYAFAPLSTVARWALFGAWLLTLAITIKLGFAPVFRKISHVTLARWLEGRHPEMQERLSTSIELDGHERGVSIELLDELRKAATIDATTVNAYEEIKTAQTTFRWGRPAAALAVIFGIAFIAWPNESIRLLVRAVAPFSHWGNVGATSFAIKPGSLELIAGDRLQIDVNYQGQDAAVELIMEMEDRTQATQSLTLKDDSYAYVLQPVTQSFRYYARAGRAESDSYQITVWPLPILLDSRVNIQYPDYINLAATNATLDKGVSAVVGSRVTVTAKTNTSVESAWLEVDGKNISQATVTNVSGTSQLDFSWQIHEPGQVVATIILKHRLGKEVNAATFFIESLADAAPQVMLISPSEKEIRLRPDETLDLRYEVIEDFALARVSVELSENEKPQISLGQNLPTQIIATKPPHFRGDAPLAIGDLRQRLGGKNHFRVRVRAEDGRPRDMSGPGIGYSDWLRVIIDQNAESLVRQQLREQHEGAMKKIDEVIKDVREAREHMNQHREEIKQDKLTENGEKNLAEAAEKLADAQEKTNEVAQKMQESVHSPQADKVAQAAEKMQQSREQMEDAPLQDDTAHREEKIDQAKKLAEESIQQLEAVKQEMQKQNEKIQDLARMQELAQKQQELARQAQQQAQNKPSEQEKQQWQQQQEQVEQQIRQELNEQPQAKAEALKQQSEQAQQLADQAKEMAQDQQKLQQEAQQSTENNPQAEEQLKEAVKQGLAAEQEKITEQTKEQLEQAREDRSALADVLPKAAEATEQASEKIQQPDNQKAAEATQAAAEALKATAAQAEKSNEAANPEEGKELANENGEQAKSPNDSSQQEKNQQAAAEASKETAAQAEKSNEAANADAGKELAKESGEQENSPNDSSQQEKNQQAAQSEALAELSERQAQVAEAMKDLAEGKTDEALQALQAMKAAEAQELAEAIDALPQVDQSSPMQQAEQASKQGGEQAQQAAQQAQQGQQQQAAAEHQQSQQNFEKSAQSLGQAAQDMAQAAQQAAQQQTQPEQAQASPQALAEAFQQASQASENSQPSQAAQQAEQAAKALSQAAQSAKSKMQGNQPGKPMAQQPGPKGEPGTQPGQESQNTERPAEGDPGVPPELAKLGISAADWEKIQASLNSDVSSGGAQAVPEEYRELVKGYFQSMSQKTLK